MTKPLQPMTLKTRFQKMAFNWFPAFRRTGGRITWMANDHKEIHLKLALTWRTRNYVGTLFGGSMYAFVDPIYMVMFIRALGRDYVVWDKAARIRYRRPAKTTLRAVCSIGDAELAAIRDGLAQTDSLERVYLIELHDEAGTLCAEVEKTLYFSRRRSD